MLRSFLEKNNGWVLSLVAGIAAFGTYSCMYAYRKAFSAGTYTGLHFFGVDYKILLVIAQVFGYMLSKIIGIKMVSGISGRYRLKAIAYLIGFAWLSLLGFALVPPPYNIAFLFLNGLPLGMIWGLVFSFLEGRKNTELMAAIMACSLVFASGFVKSSGRMLLQVYHVSEFWMPFFTGFLFVGPLAVFLFIIGHLPPPSAADIAARSERKPMNNSERLEMIRNYWPGIACIVVIYLMLTIVRDIRDNFEVEIWSALGFGRQPAIFTQIDLPVALGVLVVLSLLVLVRNNMKAFVYLHCILMAGLMLAALAAILFITERIGPLIFMSVAAFGLYLAYIPCNSIVFERMISAFQIRGNVGFVMYLADAMGYLGSVSILLYKQFGAPHISWLRFFTNGLVLIGIGGAFFTLLSMRYFLKKYEHTISVTTISITQ